MKVANQRRVRAVKNQNLRTTVVHRMVVEKGVGSMQIHHLIFQNQSKKRKKRVKCPLMKQNLPAFRLQV